MTLSQQIKEKKRRPAAKVKTAAEKALPVIHQGRGEPAQAASRYLFISSKGEMLPRWQHAFSSSSVISIAPDNTSGMLQKAELVWLRLQAGGTVVQQIQAARRQVGDAVIVVLSDTPNDDEGMEAFWASARGYCNSHASAEVLRQVASVVSQGGLWIGESLMSRLLTGMHRVTAQPSLNVANGKHAWENKLTGREWEVAQVVATGASNKEVARQLGITERTVKAHVGVIFAKLEVQDRLHLALRIRELDVVSTNDVRADLNGLKNDPKKRS